MECCNNQVNGRCCHEVVQTDNKSVRHITPAEDEHYHEQADSHVFMMNGLLVAKDTARPRDSFFEHENWGNC